MKGPREKKSPKNSLPSMSGEQSKIPGAAQRCDLNNRPEFSHEKRDSGAEGGGTERLLGSWTEQGRKADLSDSSARAKLLRTWLEKGS